MEVSVEYLGGVQFEIDARGHKLLSDQPAGNGGFDEGVTPPEFLLASLGSCAGYYAVEYLRTRKIDAGGTRVKVTAGKAKSPARLDQFCIEVDVPSTLNAADIAGVEKAVQRCLVHNTLTHPPSIALSVRAEETVPVG